MKESNKPNIVSQNVTRLTGLLDLFFSPQFRVEKREVKFNNRGLQSIIKVKNVAPTTASELAIQDF